MTYIDYLNDFNRWIKSNFLPGSSRLLYYAILSVFNETGWPESIQVDNYRLMSMVDTRTERVAISARDKLVDAGFIGYIKGKKRSPNTYYLKKYTLQKVSEIDRVSDSESVSVSVSDSVPKTVSHIKTKNKTNISPLPPSTDFGPELQRAVMDWLSYKDEKKQAYKPTGLKMLISKIKNSAEEYGETAVANLIQECMASNWQGIIFSRLKDKQKGGSEYADVI